MQSCTKSREESIYQRLEKKGRLIPIPSHLLITSVKNSPCCSLQSSRDFWTDSKLIICKNERIIVWLTGYRRRFVKNQGTRYHLSFETSVPQGFDMGPRSKKICKRGRLSFLSADKKPQRTSWMQLKRVWNIRVFLRTMPNLGQFQFWLWEVITKMSEKNSNSLKIQFLNLLNWKRIQNFLILTKIQKSKHRSVIVMVTWKVGHF